MNLNLVIYMDNTKPQIDEKVQAAYHDFYKKCCVPSLDYLYDDNNGMKVYSTTYAAPAFNKANDVYDCCEMFLLKFHPEVEFSEDDFRACLLADKRVIGEGNEYRIPIALTHYAAKDYLALEMPSFVKDEPKTGRGRKKDKDVVQDDQMGVSDIFPPF